MPCDNQEAWDGGRWEGVSRRGNICIFTGDSHCFTAETNKTLQGNYPPIKNRYLVSFFLTSGWPVFPAPLVKEIVFNPLYILASFVKDKVSLGAWIYLWAFYFVPLIYISVFVPVPYCLEDCGFVVEPEVRRVDSSSSILLSQDCFGYLRFFVFPYKLWNYLF